MTTGLDCEHPLALLLASSLWSAGHPCRLATAGPGIVLKVTLWRWGFYFLSAVGPDGCVSIPNGLSLACLCGIWTELHCVGHCLRVQLLAGRL
jgi:hypothetical protein